MESLECQAVHLIAFCHQSGTLEGWQTPVRAVLQEAHWAADNGGGSWSRKEGRNASEGYLRGLVGKGPTLRQ